MYTDNLLLHITMQFLTMPEVEKTTNRVGGGIKGRKKNHYQKQFLKHRSHCV